MIPWVENRLSSGREGNKALNVGLMLIVKTMNFSGVKTKVCLERSPAFRARHTGKGVSLGFELIVTTRKQPHQNFTECPALTIPQPPPHPPPFAKTSPLYQCQGVDSGHLWIYYKQRLCVSGVCFSRFTCPLPPTNGIGASSVTSLAKIVTVRGVEGVPSGATVSDLSNLAAFGVTRNRATPCFS